MEAKKEPGADLSRKSWLFMGIGATIALSFVITAFEWKAHDPLVDISAKGFDHFPDAVQIPQTEILPPAPKPRPITFVPVKAEVETPVPKIDQLVTSLTRIDSVAPVIEVPPEPVDEWFIAVEESTAPKGGIAVFYRYVSENIKYPPQARRMGIDGRVFVEFIVAKDGTLTDVKAIKGIGGGCDEEAVRVVKSSPPWNPGKQRGKPVRQKLTLPITFKLG